MIFKRAIGPIMILFVLLVSASLCYAATGIPEIIGYEGRLTNASDGSPVATATTFTFKIYDAATAGTVLATSSESITPDINGVFSTVIGVSDTVFTGADRWLGVTVSPDTTEMTPRIRFASAPYAYKALNGTTPVVNNPSTGFSIASVAGDTQYGGTVTSTTLNWSEDPGTSDTLVSMSIHRSDNVYNNTPAGTSGSVTDPNSYNSGNVPSYTFTATFQNYGPIVKTVTVGFHYVKYIGAATHDPATVSDITSGTVLTPATTAALGATYVTLTNNEYLFYAYPTAIFPAGLNTDTDLTIDNSGVFTDWTVTNPSITHGVASIPYSVYTDNQPYNASHSLTVNLY